MAEVIIAATTAESAAYDTLTTIAAGSTVLVGATALQDQEHVKLSLMYNTTLHCPINTVVPERVRNVSHTVDTELTADFTVREFTNNTNSTITLGYWKSATKAACAIIAWT